MARINVNVDGVAYSDEVENRTLLVQYLREQLGKTGTVVGCDTNNCGACTVHLDGHSVKSCGMLAVQADGHEVITIEGLAQDGVLHPMQEAFRECHALQCGFCTPGMIMSSIDLLNERALRATCAGARGIRTSSRPCSRWHEPRLGRALPLRRALWLPLTCWLTALLR
jgi:carbon-monoxide dehydrogenase small subunit